MPIRPSTPPKKTTHQSKSLETSTSKPLLKPRQASTVSDKKNTQQPQNKSIESCANNDIHYIFKAEGPHLSCIISVNKKIDLSFIKMLLDTLYVFQVLDLSTPELRIDYQKDTVKIVFRTMSQFNQYQVVINFIHRLKEMGLRELHENKNAMWFYSNSGNEILNIHNYPPTLQEFLLEESKMMTEILQLSNYTTLVEVGCGQMVNFELAKRNNMRYLGIDFSPQAILSAQTEIERTPEKYPKASVACINFFEMGQHTHLFRTHDRPVFFLPFNLFGNIAPISLLLVKLRQIQADLLISIYNTSPETNQMRHNYYLNCGYKNIVTRADETGVVFSSDEGLYTVAYDKHYLTELFQRLGFNVSTMDSGKYGYILYAKSIPFNNTLEQTPITHKEEEPSKERLSHKRQNAHGIQPTFLIKCLLAGSAVSLGYLLSSRNIPLKKPALITGATSAILSGFALFKMNQQRAKHIVPQSPRSGL